MDIKEFSKLIIQKKKLVAYFVLVFFTISAVFTVIQPFEYEAQMRIMIVQTFEQELEPYSIAKSNQYLSSILTNVLISDSFYDKVVNSKFNINKDYFYSFNKTEIEIWRRTVHVGAVDDTGIINLQVLHTDKYQAEEISKAILAVIQDNYQEYYKVEHAVEIKLLDKIQVSNMPVKPNVVSNLSFGFLFGILAGLCYIYLFAEKFQRELNVKEIRKHHVVHKRLENQSRNEKKVMDSEVLEKTVAEETKQEKDKAQIVAKANHKKQRKLQGQPRHLIGAKKTLPKTGYKQSDYNKIVEKGDINNLFG